MVTVRLFIDMRPAPWRRPKLRDINSRTVSSRTASSSLFSISSNRMPCSVWLPVSSAMPTRCATRRARTVENDNFSTSRTMFRNREPRTLKTLSDSSGFCKQIFRKLSEGNHNRVVSESASAPVKCRPPSNTGTSASEPPGRSIPISCCLPLGADLTIRTLPCSIINKSWHTSPSEKMRDPRSYIRWVTCSAITEISSFERSANRGTLRSVVVRLCFVASIE